MEFIEASSFTRHVYLYLSEEEYVEFKLYLATTPEAGSVVPGSGGVRKVRWKSHNTGKSGGIRVIYYFKKRDGEIWLLTIYSKTDQVNIPSHILKSIAKEVEHD